LFPGLFIIVTFKENKASLTSLNIPKSACVVCRPSQQLACVPYYQSRSLTINNKLLNLHVFHTDILRLQHSVYIKYNINSLTVSSKDQNSMTHTDQSGN